MVHSWKFGVAVLAARLLVASRAESFPPPEPLHATAVAVDRHGLPWVAALEGVFRFDGAHYHRIPGYPFREARFIGVDPVGRVWVGSPQGLVVWETSAWRVVLREPVTAMATARDGVWVAAPGLLHFDEREQRREVARARPTGELTLDAAGAVWFPCGGSVCVVRRPGDRLESRPIPVAGRWSKLVATGEWRYWLSSRDAFALVEDRRVLFERAIGVTQPAWSFSATLDPVMGPDGRVWFTRMQAGRPPQAESSPHHGFAGSFTGPSDFWLAAEGVAWVHNTPDWRGWEVAGGITARGLTPREAGAPWVFTDRGIYELPEPGSPWERAQAGPLADVLMMVDDGQGGYWAPTREEGLLHLDPALRTTERFPQICQALNSLRTGLRDRRGRIWIGGKEPGCFFEIQGRPGQPRFVPQKLPVATENAVALSQDAQGRPWVGYEHGLAYLNDDGEWRRIETTEPVLQVRSLVLDGDDAIWVSGRRPGPFLRLERRGAAWAVRRFEGADFGSESWFMRLDSRGWLWRGTPEGVSIARPGRYARDEWLRLTLANGLAGSGETLHGWSEHAGAVWVTGNKGVTRLEPSGDWFAAPVGVQPFISRIRAGGREWLEPGRMPKELPPGAVEIDFSSIAANRRLGTPMRYRLDGGDWRPLRDGRLALADVRDSPRIEVQYAGDGPAAPAVFTFAVAVPLTRYLPFAFAGSLALAAVPAWRRRQWLFYWIRKRVFEARRRWGGAKGPEGPRDYAGETLGAGRYAIRDCLGRGGFSITYRASDLTTGDAVVVKVLARPAGDELWVRDRFAHEVAAMHTVRHAGVMRLLDSFVTSAGEPCLVMPLLQGQTLRAVLDLHRPDRARTARLLRALGAALGAIHRAGIVHRDLKPENIFVENPATADEYPVILDFGAAAPRGAERELAHTTTLTGSLHYLAPERLANQYSPASDIYALGAIALEMLTGKRPAELEVASADARFVERLAQVAGEAAAALIAEALRHQPLDRPQDAAIWAARLAVALGDQRGV